MKNYILFLVAFCMIWSLFGQTTSVKNPFPTAERDGILKILTGNWIEKQYLEELTKTKSPYDTYLKDREWTTLSIKKDKQDVNVFNVEMIEGFSVHNEAKFPMLINGAWAFESEGVIINRLRILKDDNNNLIFIDGFNKRTATYVKCTSINSTVNDAVIAGTYVNESDPAKSKITFSKDGSVTGVNNEITYTLAMRPGKDKYNSISFYNADKANTDFYYEFVGNILNIYTINQDYDEEYDDYISSKGELKYKLTKTN
jgi:hypothetical protein